MKREEIALFPRLLDLLHQTVDCASDLIIGMEISQAGNFRVGEIIQKLEKGDTSKTQRFRQRRDNGYTTRFARPRPGKSRGKDTWGRSIPKISIFIPEAPPVAVPAPSSTGTIRISTAKLDALLLQAEEMLSVKLAAGQLALELKVLKNSFTQWEKGKGKKAIVQNSPWARNTG